MAQLLIKAVDSPVRNSPGKWSAGDVVCVFDDAHSFGTAETPPAFWIVRVPATAAQVQDWLDENPGVARRLNRLDVANLSPARLEALNAGPVSLTRTQLSALRKRIA